VCAQDDLAFHAKQKADAAVRHACSSLCRLPPTHPEPYGGERLEPGESGHLFRRLLYLSCCSALLLLSISSSSTPRGLLLLTKPSEKQAIKAMAEKAKGKGAFGGGGIKKSGK
jgi:hypothetical protein